MAIVTDTARDSSSFERGLEVSNSGPVDVTNQQHHFPRKRFLRNRPGSVCNISSNSCHNRGYASIAGKSKDGAHVASEACLRHSLHQKQRGRRRKVVNRQHRHENMANEKLYRKKEHPIREKGRKPHNALEDSAKAIMEEKEASGISMPPPSEAMTDLVLLQRQNRYICHNFPLCNGLDVIREEKSNGEEVKASVQSDQQPIAHTRFVNATKAVVIADSIEKDPTGIMYTTTSDNTLSQYNPNGYHFTNLNDGTQVYSSMSPFSSMAIDEDGDINKIGHTEKEGTKNDGVLSCTNLKSSSPSETHAHIIDDNLEGVIYVGRSSIGPLAQSSPMIGTKKRFQQKSSGEKPNVDQYHDRNDAEEYIHLNEANIAMTDSDSVVDGGRFASSTNSDSSSSSNDVIDDGKVSSSSIESLSSSISSIAIVADSDDTNANSRAYEPDNRLRFDKRRKTERYSTASKRYSVDHADIEDTELEEDTSKSPIPEANRIQFKDIIGHQSVKLRLDEVLLPMALPASLSKTILTGIRTLPASILMYGPPGCGKTHLAKAIAGEAHAAFLSIGPSDILSKYVGESEEAVRCVFAEAVRLARNNRGGNKCTVLFFDEIDALGQSRGLGGGDNGALGRGGMSGTATGRMGEDDGSGSGDHSSRRILAELLIQLTKLNAAHGTYDSLTRTDLDDCDEKVTETPNISLRGEEKKDEDCCHSYESIFYQDKMIMKQDVEVKHQYYGSGTDSLKNDNCTVRVIVVAATNRLNDCDPALIRRFSVQVKVGLPTEKDRRKMLKRSMEDIDHTITKKQFWDLSSITEGWSGSDLQSLAREAAMAPVRECIRRAALLKRQMFVSNSHQGNKNVDDAIETQMHLEDRTQNVSQRKSDIRNTDFTVPQERLLEEFRDIRPVDFQDCKKALTFWFSQMYNDLNDSPLAGFGWIEDSDINCKTNGIRALTEHYDSSSDEDDEEIPILVGDDQMQIRNVQENDSDSEQCDIVI